jgi:hypothetical protein
MATISPGRIKAANITDLTKKRHCGECLDAAEAAEGFHRSTIRRRLSDPFDLGVEAVALRLQVLEMLELGDDDDLKGISQELPEFDLVRGRADASHAPSHLHGTDGRSCGH